MTGKHRARRRQVRDLVVVSPLIFEGDTARGGVISRFTVNVPGDHWRTGTPVAQARKPGERFKFQVELSKNVPLAESRRRGLALRTDFM